jgi:glycine cleavage system T protein
MNPAYPYLSGKLADIDQDTFRFIEMEKRRQERKIILIASESICPEPVLEAEASVFSNIYAEGYPSLRLSQRERERILETSRYLAFHRRYGDRRHYKGCDYVNFIEVLAQKRAAQVFAHKDEYIDIKPEDIYVNVQALSGAAANNSVYQALVKPGETVIGLALPHGGHLTHGSEFNRSGRLHHVVSYQIHEDTGHIDYDEIRELALREKPRMIIGGASAYPWKIDWRRLRQIADEVGAYLLADIAHPSGLVIAGLFPNPVGYAHVVTMTTHKTMCGPRGALILTTDKEIAHKIDNGVFPGEQGGPHVNTIAALAVALQLASTQEYKNLMTRVVENAKALAENLEKEGLEIACGGTETHLCLVNLRKIKTASGLPLKGDIASNLLDICGITCNKNTIPGDVTSTDSSAIRLGTTWVTELGMGKEEMAELAHLIALLLKNADTFNVETAGGARCRARVDRAILEEVRLGVQKLMMKDYYPNYPLYPHYFHPIQGLQRKSTARDNEKLVDVNGLQIVWSLGNEEAEKAALKEKAVLVSNPEQGLLEITGERAELFLASVITGNVYNLELYKGMRTWLLDADGNVISSVQIFRLPAIRKEESCFFMSVPACKREIVKNWLRDLSDGYVSFDKHCIYNKIDGPVTITDWTDEVTTMSTLFVAGPKANDIASKLLPAGTELNAYRMWKLENESDTYMTRIQANDSLYWYEIYTTKEAMPALIERIKGIYPEAVETGMMAIASILEEAGLCGLKDGVAVVEKYPTDIDLSKPYFIGHYSIREHVKPVALEQHVFKTYDGEPRETCLCAEHKKISNRALVPFAGWKMPILYTSILEEHDAVRNTAGLFDVTHMGVVEVAGKGAARFLDLISTNYVSKMMPNQSLYGYLIDPEGKVIDDIMVYCRAWEKFMIVINAANAEKDIEWMMKIASKKVVIDLDNPQATVDVVPVIRDLKDPKAGKDQKVDIALQGPNSLKIMQKLASDNPALQEKMAKLAKATFIEDTIQGVDAVISRSGYTGEDWGFELYIHPDDAAKLWQLILEQGKEYGVQPTALGARDSTRTEAGFPLYGHELASDLNITPWEAGYGSFVKYHKPFFIGKSRLLAQDQTSKNVIVRFSMRETGIRAVRPGAFVVNKKGQRIGVVTSCAFVGENQIGMAYIDRKYAQIGNAIGIFQVTPGKQIKHKNIADLQCGDTFPMHESATIISRFPMRNAQPAKKD